MSATAKGIPMQNAYMDYFVNQHVNWHEKKIGVYHVSSIGNNHQDLDPKEHYGPCLRQTFYNFINWLPDNLSSKGNLQIGTILHKHVQDLYKLNHPNCVLEFPVSRYLPNKLLSVGSIDILEQFLNWNDILFDVIDIKTASPYTLPKNKWDRNPTYFSQIRIYGGKLLKYLNLDLCQIRKFKLVYINKHNLETFEIPAVFDYGEIEDGLDDYGTRCAILHGYLTKTKLPTKEPMRWCKYCKYKFRCEEDSIKSADKGIFWRRKHLNEFAQEDIVTMAENSDI